MDPIYIMCSTLQIAYKIAREQFPNRLRETFLVLNDDEPKPVQMDARRLSLEPANDLTSRQSRKHRRDPDSMSVESGSHPKKPDQTRSTEKRK